MAKSSETFGKKEKQKNKLKKRQDKAEKMEKRKANTQKGKSLEDMMAYLDENGNLSTTPPDPSKRKVFKQEDIEISVPKYVPAEDDGLPRNGVVTFFNDAKGFGFIKDLKSQESIFVHAKQLSEPIRENDKVSFDIEMGPRGASAINVNKVKA